MKIAVIGAGNVGAMTASRIIDAGLADVVLMDIVPCIAKAKALDISDARPIFNSAAKITGTERIEDINNADIVVITAGHARKPGMSRDDLLKKNSQILRSISSQIKRHCLSSIVIVVTNPLEAMSYLVMKTTGFGPRRVIGMAGVLDSARFINIASEEGLSIDKNKIFLMGSHGDTMVAIGRSKAISGRTFKGIYERTKNRGAEIVSYLKTGSAYFAPSASVFYMLAAILKNTRETLCVTAYLQGEYEESDIYIGVPAVLDSSGVKEIVELELESKEKAAFKKSAHEIRTTIKKLTL